MPRLWMIIVLMVFIWCESALADDLTEWSLEDLMNVEITSASKKSTSLHQTTAASFVLTQEDIRRSGVNNIPEALRLVPGLHVAKSSANTWSITSRGFNSRFANKLLVMVDGRSIYSLLFGGVFWEHLDVQMQDIARIEVIRGPGATLWGSNAVNGVVNIITKESATTQGLFVSTTVGDKGMRMANARYGAKVENLAYRVYASSRQDDGNLDQVGDLKTQSTGLRSDWQEGKNSISVQANYYQAKLAQQVTLATLLPPFSVMQDEIARANGGHLMLDWQRQQSDTQLWKLQLYYDSTKRRELSFQEDRQVANIDLSHQVTFNASHELIWGMGYRTSQDHLNQVVSAVVFTPPKEKLKITNLFVQHEWKIMPDILHLTLGSKFEHHSVTGLAFQPNARLLWNVNEGNMFWASVAKAIRQPSRVIRGYNLHLPNLSPVLGVSLVGQGNAQLQPEEMLAYEMGYRLQYDDQFGMDVSLFYQDYRNSLTNEIGQVRIHNVPFPHPIIPAVAGNLRKTQVYGVEISTQWQVTDWWQLHTSYSYLRMKVQLDAQSTSGLFASSFIEEGTDPRQKAVLRSQMNVSDKFKLDSTVRYVSKMRSTQVAAYTALDIRLAYQWSDALELSVVGRNITDKKILEDVPSRFIVLPQTEVQRRFHAKLTWLY